MPIPCLTWIKRGVMSGRPQRVKLTNEEISQIVKGKQDHTNRSDDSDESDEDNQDSDSASSIDEIYKKYDLGDYDDDDQAGDSSTGLGGSNKDGQYLADSDNDSDEEAEIQADDNILALGKVTGDIFGLESYVYNEGSSSLYCHHDTILSSFPLAMEWVGFDPGENSPGNLLAVGSMEPQIELWDVDVMDTLEPAFVLHGAQKKKGKKKMKISGKGHTDAVLDLSWNALQPNALASGSADFTIGLWDIEDGEMVMSITDHAEKVQAVKWHPFEPHTLLSGSFDHTAKVFDCRHSDTSHKSWNLSGEVERVTWNTHDPFYFMASTDTGHVYYVDVRSDKPVFTIQAHDSAITGLSISSELRGCLVTSSTDKLIKVWDIRENKPDLVFTKNFKLGEIHCMEACPDSGFIYAVGGETELRIFHLKTSEEVLHQWNMEIPEGIKIKANESDDEDDDDDLSDSSISCDGYDEYIDFDGDKMSETNKKPAINEAARKKRSDDVPVPKKPKKKSKKTPIQDQMKEKLGHESETHSKKKKKEKRVEKIISKGVDNIDKTNSGSSESLNKIKKKKKKKKRPKIKD